MWLKNLFKRTSSSESTNIAPLFDEALLRRMERLNFRTSPWLRGNMIGERRSRNLRPALDFSDHRPYTSGDDLRYIDWNAFGRTDSLFVRLGEAPQSVAVHILLDRSPSMTWQPPDASQPTKWNSARQLTGALGYLGLSGGEQLLITPFDLKLGDSFGPTRGKRRLIRALQFISAIQPTPPQKEPAIMTAAGGFQKKRDQLDLATSFTNYARQYPNGGLLIIISDLLDTVSLDNVSQKPAAERLADGLRHLTPPRWQVLFLHLLTTAEVDPGFEGDLDLQDMETGQVLPFHFDESTMIQYKLRVRRWCAELQSACGKRGATYARVLVEWPLEQAVVPYLRQRGMVR